jgi:hypothetical protein
MTESQWLASADLRSMLPFLRGQSTQRKFRLFMCASCRRQWDRNTPGVVKQAVEVAEQFADGVIGKDTLRQAQQDLEEPLRPLSSLAGWTLTPDARGATEILGYSLRKEERRAHAELLREVIGNPFRGAKADPAWLAWNGGTVVALAESIYQERAFDQLPVLADALEDAGCRDSDLLAHCRAPGPHVRGCWVVDLMLGRR